MNEKISNMRQIGSVTCYTITSGKGKGLDVIDCTVGKMRVLLNESKALDIMQVYFEGENISFLSKNAFKTQRKGFSDRFEGGMLYTCGLDCLGVIDGYEIHGSFHNLRADVISAEYTGSNVIVKADIEDTALFGKNLVIHRTVTIDGNSISVSDVLENNAFRDEEFCLLYHTNIGYPLLDEGGKIIADVKSCTPRTPYAVKMSAECFDITAPAPCREETCYFLKFNENKITYRNEQAGKDLTLEFNGDGLDCFVLWKSMASGDYALGLEPCTTEQDENFHRSVIPAGAKKCYNIKITLGHIK